MNTLRAVFGAIVWLGAVAAGVWIFGASLGGTPRCDAAAWIRDAPAMARAVGAGLVAVAVLWPVTLIVRGGRERHLSFRNPEGEVRVSLSAIRDFLARLAAEFPAVITLRPSISVRGSVLTVDMEARVRAGIEIPDLTRRIQERVRESVRACLGIAEVGEVRVTVREIMGPVPPAEPSVRTPKASEGPAGFVDTAAGEEHPAS